MSVTPCEGLLNILSDAPGASSLGNFTETPDEQLIRDCANQHAVYMLDGEILATELKRPAPDVKVLCLDCRALCISTQRKCLVVSISLRTRANTMDASCGTRMTLCEY